VWDACQKLTLSRMLLHHHGCSGWHLHIHLSRMSLLRALLAHGMSASVSWAGLWGGVAREMRLYMAGNW
jgi:uncharacterized membrane protein